MKSFFQSLFYGRVKILVSGLNLNLLLYKLQQKKIKLINVERKDNELSFVISYAKLNLVKRIAKLMRLDIKLTYLGGLRGLSFRLLTKTGAIVAIVFWLVFSLVFYNASKFIVVTMANGTSAPIEITEFIELNKNCSNRELERKIMVNFDDVDSCTITRRGIYVNAIIYNKIKASDNLPIVAPCDCVVLELRLLSGRAIAEVGQVLKKGDVIIEPLTLASGEIEPARGDVIISGYVSASVTFAKTQQKLVRTGASFSENIISIFELNLFKEKGCIWQYYETETQTQFISNNNVLPIKNTKITYFELVLTEFEANFADFENDLRVQAESEARKLVPNNAEDLATKIVIEERNSMVEVSCFIKFKAVIN